MHPQEKGFTLIEVAVSLLAFAAVIVIFASAVVMSEKTAHMNGQYAQAMSLCQHKIDQMRAIGFGQLEYDTLEGIYVDDSSIASPYSFLETDNVANYLPRPTAATLTIEKPYNSDEDKAKVTATITWHPVASQSKTNTVTLVALITNVD